MVKSSRHSTATSSTWPKRGSSSPFSPFTAPAFSMYQLT
jgi:hypothetical protein